MLMHRLNIIVIVSLLYACSAEATPGKLTTQISEADTGSLIELHIGDKLEITLPGNPTTGFQWEVSAVDNASFNQLVSQSLNHQVMQLAVEG